MTRIEEISKQIGKMVESNAKAIKAAEEGSAKAINDIADADARASAALSKGDIDEYRKALDDKQAAEFLRTSLQHQMKELKEKPLLDPAESERLKKEIEKEEAAARETEEKAAVEHIEAIVKLADNAGTRGDTARNLIKEIITKVDRLEANNGNIAAIYASERIPERIIPYSPLLQVALNFTDPTYHLSYLYQKYKKK